MSTVSTFRFAHDGIAYDGRCEGETLVVSADLGALPYSAEDRAARKRWQQVIASENPRASDRHRIDRAAHIRFETRTRVDAPLDRRGLIEALTVILLAGPKGAPGPTQTAGQPQSAGQPQAPGRTQAPVRRFRAERGG